MSRRDAVGGTPCRRPAAFQNVSDSKGRGYYILKTTGNDRSTEDISESDSLTNQEGVGEEVLLENRDSLQGFLDSGVQGLLVVNITADQWTEPRAQRRENFGVVEGHPLQNRGIFVLGLSKKGGLLILRGHCNGVSEHSLFHPAF